MILATHFHDNGDGTAWWVPANCSPDRACAMMPDDPCVKHAQYFDRPCDTCGGSMVAGATSSGLDGYQRCLDCFNGRHAFTIELEGHWGGVDGHATHWVFPRTLRVAVREVLPIREYGGLYPLIDHEHLEHWHGDKWFHWMRNDRRRFGDPASSPRVWEAATLPPAAEPGGYAVLLDIDQGDDHE